MSFWFRRKDPGGRVHGISAAIVVLVLLVLVDIVGVLLAILLPLVQQWFRSWIQGG